MATAEWYTEILDFLASYDIALGDVSDVLDTANNPAEYGDVPPLCLAAMTGKLRMVQALVKRGVDINQRTSIGDTALFEACFEGHSNVAQYLVQQGANIELANFKKITCMMIASYANNFQIVRMLVSLGADLSKRDDNGRNALFYCIPAGNLTTLQYLLDNGGKMEPDYHGMNALMEAAHHGHFEMVKYFIANEKQLGMSKNDFDSKGRNVLFYVSEGGHVDVFQYLIQQGITVRPALDGSTVLMEACLKRHAHMVEYFLDNASKIGVDLNKCEKHGRNALFYAISGGNVDIFDRLVQKGVEVVTSDQGVNLFIQSAAKGDIEFVRHLYEKSGSLGLDVHATDQDGWNALFFAVARGNLELVLYLIKCGIRPKIAEKDGRNLLMQAAINGDEDVLGHLCDNMASYGLDLSQIDKNGWSVLYYCIEGENIDLFLRLKAKGAPLCKSVTGGNVLMETAGKAILTMVNFLLDHKDDLELDINCKDQEGRNAAFFASIGGNVEIFQRIVDSGGVVDSDKKAQTVLMKAAELKHLDLIKHLIEHENTYNYHKNGRDHKQRTALFYAVESGSVEIVEYLVDSGVEGPTDQDGVSLLMLAAESGDIDLLGYVLDKSGSLKIDKNDLNSAGENALIYGRRSGNSDVTKLLLHSGVRLVVSKSGMNAFADCILNRDHDTLNNILATAVDFCEVVNHPDAGGRNCFHHCVELGDADVLQKIAQFYDPERDRDVKGTTSLMVACYKKDLDLMKFLVEDLYVDMHVRDERGMDAILHAVQASNLVMVKYLLAYGAACAPDNSGRTAVMIAAQLCDCDILEHLVRFVFRRNQCVNDCDAKHQTALIYAVKHDRDEAVEVLAQNGAEINQSDDAGVTPLLIAVRRRNVKTASALIKNGADANAIDTRGRNALHYCFEKENHSLGLIKLLLEEGADVNAADETGTTPLMLAVKFDNLRPIRLMIESGASLTATDFQEKTVIDYCPPDRHIIRVLLEKHAEMSRKQREILEVYRENLEASVEMDNLLPFLVDQGMLSRSDRREISSDDTPAVKMSKLLKLLTKKGPRAFDVLCAALEKEHEGLADDLLRAGRAPTPAASVKSEFYV
ncbi:uncharacterized protein LOC141910276 [Tubulanus polymorphus]|uniref:uncharacterized protein LOC141910276 n=1 Tax=Tubulanus polymorphus TaxID=672921 RepID=UPI003DA4B15A